MRIQGPRYSLFVWYYNHTRQACTYPSCFTIYFHYGIFITLWHTPYASTACIIMIVADVRTPNRGRASATTTVTPLYHAIRIVLEPLNNLCLGEVGRSPENQFLCYWRVRHGGNAIFFSRCSVNLHHWWPFRRGRWHDDGDTLLGTTLLIAPPWYTTSCPVRDRRILRSLPHAEYEG